MSSVKLRTKVVKQGISLYLDIYHTGKRKYEFLKLYYEARPKTPEAKQHKKEILKLAEQIRAKRLLQLEKSNYDLTTTYKAQVLLIDYFDASIKDKKNAGKKVQNWLGTTKHLKAYLDNDRVYLNEVTADLLEGFRKYLLANLRINTASVYFSALLFSIKKAIKEGYLNLKLTDLPAYISIENTQRTYLTIDEIQKLAKTDCKRPELKRAFLFSCFTGLRFSDIQKLTWAEVKQYRGQNWKIEFTQKKTKDFEYMPISEQAKALLGKPKYEDEKVFNITYSNIGNMILKLWFANAGISKDLTFHSARHSFATMLLTYGTDIYTASKLLGHKKVDTTQIYAKIVDVKKEDAVNSLPGIKL